MYAYLTGKVVQKGEDFAIIECQGIGYELSMSLNSLAELEIAREMTIYTRLIVKEDELSLCGFTSIEERTLFDHLLTVSGIGKKIALSAISTSGVDSIIRWIISEDYKSIVKLNGIGKKTAERLVVELRDKFKKLYGELKPADIDSQENQNTMSLQDDIVLALSGLGFNQSEIHRMCEGMPDGLDVEGAIKYALKKRNKS